jgi:hypothetical protein
MRATLWAVMLMACGPTTDDGSTGSSGIPGSKKLAEMTLQEAMDLCLELADDYPERTVSCSSGETFSAGYTVSECASEMVAPGSCMASVADIRRCAASFYNSSDAELCASDSFPSACDPLLEDDCPF